MDRRGNEPAPRNEWSERGKAHPTPLSHRRWTNQPSTAPQVIDVDAKGRGGRGRGKASAPPAGLDIGEQANGTVPNNHNLGRVERAEKRRASLVRHAVRASVAPLRH